MVTPQQKDFIFLTTGFLAIMLTTFLGFYMSNFDVDPWIWIMVMVIATFAIVVVIYYLRKHMERNSKRIIPKMQKSKPGRKR